MTTTIQIGSYEFSEPEFILYIKSLANNECKMHKELRFGQSVLNITYGLCGNVVDDFRGSDKDCFYNSDKVDTFLQSTFNKILNK